MGSIDIACSIPRGSHVKTTFKAANWRYIRVYQGCSNLRSGKLAVCPVCYGQSPSLVGKSTTSMGHGFNSKRLNNQRVLGWPHGVGFAEQRFFWSTFPFLKFPSGNLRGVFFWGVALKQMQVGENGPIYLCM